jgi:hypothetical protein
MMRLREEREGVSPSSRVRGEGRDIGIDGGDEMEDPKSSTPIAPLERSDVNGFRVMERKHG